MSKQTEQPETSQEEDQPLKHAKRGEKLLTLRTGYQGTASSNRFIPPGAYLESDPILLGLGAYLLENGHATED